MGFHQVELEPESRNITTFTTHVGLFRYKRLMFGISCAPEMYQQCIKMALEGCAGQRNISDDIIVYGCTQQEHDERLNKVLDRMREKGLRLKKTNSKSQKVEAVTSARNPKTASEVRSFLGLVNYCGRYIPDFSTVSAPLRELTRAKTKWIWSSRHQDAFDELKRLLASAKTLAYYNSNAETHVIVDASPVGLGAILSQKQSDGNFRPVTFASRTLTNVEQRYSQTEREAPLLLYGDVNVSICTYMERNLFLVTDHKPLGLSIPRNLNHQLVLKDGRCVYNLIRLK
ncbi:unnamed protein product [Mytilus coruscus]|uniref:Reverse transcriptase/retrotransposon-derived protein RNase H-like domain-containing protein n=1 Tax=Mytilus coruscus TaxID=42192 RepID=A0A6J8CPA1_MYTCO|nr:unnamed protein product [Mytilus coruscus]